MNDDSDYVPIIKGGQGRDGDEISDAVWVLLTAALVFICLLGLWVFLEATSHG